MKKRLVRLAASLWPFLLVVIGLYYLVGFEVPPAKIALNFSGLCWFGKIDGIGHLWFVTMIIICYIAFVAIANYLSLSKRASAGGKMWWLLLFVFIVLEQMTDMVHQPGYLFLVLFYSCFLFCNADKFMHWYGNIKGWSFWIIAIIVNVLGITISYIGLDFMGGELINRWISAASGFTWLVLLLNVGDKIKVGKWMLFISGISYEIYLVHHPLCQGPVSLHHITENPLVALLLLLCISTALGWILHKVGNRINAIILK